MDAFAVFTPGKCVPLRDLPLVSVEEFRREILEGAEQADRLAALFVLPSDAFPGAAAPGPSRLVAVLTRDREGICAAGSCEAGGGYPSLTPDCRQAHLFERELFEQTGIVPQGHPNLAPVRYPPGPGGARPHPGGAEVFRVEGGEVHEVAVGPVHAGIIEPGHFRFQCHGEHVFALSIALGYQHRGAERALLGGPGPRTIPMVETLAGDSSVGHATACAQACETLSGSTAPARGQALRSLALELERLANHIGDLGAMAGDVGFLPTSSFCGRLRGDTLNLTAALCGSRLGRGAARPGGCAFDLSPGQAQEMEQRLAAALRDTRGAVELLWGAHTVMARFENTGRVRRDTALELGLVGPVARACGVGGDVRRDFPADAYRDAVIEPVVRFHGDVAARAEVRWREAQASAAFAGALLRALPPGPALAPVGALAPHALAVSLVEGWRGRILHLAVTDAAGRFSAYRVVDPSFHNWTGLEMAMRGAQISDFPLINKSFNLSYCGFDL
jgi:Ni,Fe-hydrogenase III large subunit